jgi:hypothetical protein
MWLRLPEELDKFGRGDHPAEGFGVPLQICSEDSMPMGLLQQ